MTECIDQKHVRAYVRLHVGAYLRTYVRYARVRTYVYVRTCTGVRLRTYVYVRTCT